LWIVLAGPYAKIAKRLARIFIERAQE